MTQNESIELARQLLAAHGGLPFELSMADDAEYRLMRETFAGLGRATGPDGEFFIIRVFADGATQ